MPWREFAAEKFGSEENMRAAFARVAVAGEPDGARFDFDRIPSAPNTVDAHRLILLAADQDLQWPVADALFEPYFAGVADLDDHGQLAGIAGNAGLDPASVSGHLAGDAGAEEVWASQEEAGGPGVSGVPFYVFDGRYALSGAQPVEVFGRALDAALAGRIS